MQYKIFKKTFLGFATIIIVLMAMAFDNATSSTYKCMVQMINYTGEGAYVVISLINPQGEYEKTLYVQGDDEEWYHDISEWWRFFSKKHPNI